MARWYLQLTTFLPNLILKHKLGTANQAADALSQVPLSLGRVMHIEAEAVGTLTRKVQTSQWEDAELLQLIEYMGDGRSRSN